MKISIIIPVYNVEAYVEECLSSVVAQQCEEIECILIDDCSKDNSLAVVENFIKNTGARHVDFKIIKKLKNEGLSAARNTGLRLAAGDYIFFLDSDDTLFPDCLTKMLALAEKYAYPEIVIGKLSSNSAYYDAVLNLDPNIFPEYLEDKKIIEQHFLPHIPVVEVNKLYKKSFLDKNNIFFVEGMIFEDVVWHFDLSKHIRSVAFFHEPIYYYRYNEASIMNAAENEKKRIRGNTILIHKLIKRTVPENYKMQYFYILRLYVRFLKLDVANDNKTLHKEEVRKAYHDIMRSDISVVLKLLLFFFSNLHISQDFFWNKLLGMAYRMAKV